MTITHLSGSAIAELVTDYLGGGEEDLIFKRPILQRQFEELSPQGERFSYCQGAKSSFSHYLDSSANSALKGRDCARAAVQQVTEHQWLSWEQRPEKVKAKVTANFERILFSPHLLWVFFGEPKYSLCDIDEGRLFKSMILQAYPAQKEFWFVDIGAGDFQCGKQLALDLAQGNLPEDVQVNIVGLRGEPYSEKNESQASLPTQFRQIRLGGVKIEDIAREFERLELPIGQIDLAVCRLTLTHLNDQPGTLAQIHDLLRPGTGVFCNDSLGSLKLDQREYNSYYHDNDPSSYSVIQLLLDTGSPFLVARNRWSGYKVQHAGFILKRSGSDPCRLPWRYLPSNEGVASFTRDALLQNPWKIDSVPYCLTSKPCKNPKGKTYYYGSRSLFCWLQASNLVDDGYMPIKPRPLEHTP